MEKENFKNLKQIYYYKVKLKFIYYSYYLQSFDYILLQENFKLYNFYIQ